MEGRPSCRARERQAGGQQTIGRTGIGPTGGRRRAAGRCSDGQAGGGRTGKQAGGLGSAFQQHPVKYQTPRLMLSDVRIQLINLSVEVFLILLRIKVITQHIRVDNCVSASVTSNAL